MRSLFHEIHITVERTLARSGFTMSRILGILGIQRSWYYRQVDSGHITDGRFNTFAVRDDEWIVIGYKRRHPRMSHREIAYALMDEEVAYLSPSTVYNILKRNDLITQWKKSVWLSKKPDKPARPDEIWQTDIMYVKLSGRFFYLLIFIDVYSRYIVHHRLLASMDGNSVGNEAQTAIDILRKDSSAVPVIQSDNGSGFISMEFKTVLRENNVIHRRIRPYTPTDNAIVERVNRTVREDLESSIVSGFTDAGESINRIIHWYNNERRHSSLNYLVPAEYYRGDPDVKIAVREAKMEMAKLIRRENNIEKRKGGVATGIVS